MESATEPTAKSDCERPTGAAVIGTVFMALGGLLLFVMFAMVDRSGMKDDQELPLELPTALFANRQLWYGGAILLIGMGAALQKVGQQDDKDAVAPLFSEVVVYTRENCHLCDEAKAFLVGYSQELPMIVEVDIDPYPDLVEKYGDCVPVIEMDGKVRFRGKINPMLFERLLQATRSRSSDQFLCESD